MVIPHSRREPGSPDWAVHFQPHGAILLDRNSMYYFRLSGRGIELALLMARNRSVSKTSRIWKLVTGEDTDAGRLGAELDAHPFTAAWKEGLFNKPLTITGSTQSYLPISCTLQLTNACNLRCSFCYANSGKPYENELTPSQWMEVMLKLASHGVADVTITGGEPRLVKGFKDLVVAASSLFTNVNLFTNGLHWSDEEIELLGLLGNVAVQVSIDGKKETHDLLRGRRGAFQESMNLVRRLSEASVPVIVAMTVNQSNSHEVYGVIEESVKAGAAVFRAGRTLPVGRASFELSVLLEEQEETVKRQLRDAADRWGDRLLIMDWEESAPTGHRDFCTPGYLAWYIRADGTVTPCQIEDTAFGHILKESLPEIGSPRRLWQAKCNAKQCRCIGKVELPETDLPFTKLPVDEECS